MFKYLKMVLLFKQTAEVYKEEHKGANKPIFYSRRFVGAVITGLSGIYLLYTGVTLDLNTEEILNHIDTLVVAGTGLYGIIMSVIGQVKKQKNETPKVAP